MTLNNVLMDIQGCEIRNMGIFTISGAALKTFKYNSFYNSSYISANVSGVMNLDYNCFYNCAFFLLGPLGTSAAGSTASASTINFNYFILSTGTASGVYTTILINPRFTDFIGNVASGLVGLSNSFYFGSVAFYSLLANYNDRLSNGIVSANTIHSSSAGMAASFLTSLSVYDCNMWRISASAPGIYLGTTENIKFYNCNLYGNGSATLGSVYLTNTTGIEFNNCNFRAGTTITSSRGVVLNNLCESTFRNCTFGTGQTHSVADVQIGAPAANTFRGYIRALFENCILNSTTKFSSLTNLTDSSFIKLQRYQQTNNNHYIYTTIGNAAQYDGVIYNSGTASTRLIPLTTTFKHKSPIKVVPVASGQTPTVSVWVRKSSVSDPSGANYNGAQPRLILGYSPSVFNYTGQTEEVLATMSVGLGTWQQLTATIPYTAYSTGGFDIYVDCDGTTGWINVDDWSVL
jgi:hypothetical protein